jgi:hypothetical protein
VPTDYFDNEQQLRANGAFAHIGEIIYGLKARLCAIAAFR